MTALNPRKLELQYPGYHFNTWVIYTEHGIPPEALLDPACWAHLAKRLNRKDVVIAFAEDGAYRAELLVLDKAPLSVKVKLLSVTEMGAKTADFTVPEGYKVSWLGEIDQWGVMRGKDRLHSGSTDSMQAFSWLMTYIKQMELNPNKAAIAQPPAKQPTPAAAETL